ncbi:acyl-CoA thioesterase [Sulfuriroseicoccus oceanibius]|uniref:Acyl-CoA thioesterase n=1 Tax=Sulfuriroseicoccus oceanibius TaxID=2707525 RepID=A0A7T7F2C9_9BACT|nr:thioesterase family protein [Sulfuriroseicoccus oceanibius]QQL45531.1 acyl-CoA thioesterase [Sulfuriroseicoccus oceanibius]
MQASPDLQTPEITTHEDVMFFDTDCGGVVHNLAYLRMIETARTHLATKMGMDLRSMADSQVFPVLCRTEVDYKRPGKLGDKLRIEGTLAALERVRFWVEFRMYREADDTLLVTARQSLALVQMPAGKPMRLPADWAQRFVGSDPA